MFSDNAYPANKWNPFLQIYYPMMYDLSIYRRKIMRKKLKKGFILKESYIVKDVIGEGSSCIAYEVEEKKTMLLRVLKEFFPISVLIDRNDDGSLEIDEKQKDDFAEKRNNFEESIKKQSLLKKQKGLINQTYDLYDSFSENNTFYAVEPYFEGKPYTNKNELSLYERICVCFGVARYVEKCHSANYLCLDIKPENIFVPEDNRENPMFFDFDSMRGKDEISFGYSSYTQGWAAPEQVIPSYYNLISEATDIYSLGELIFWSVFDRHSRQEEHRRVSVYNFKDESKYYDEISSEIEDILSHIFHNTIRSSAKNRFTSVKELMKELDKLKRLLYPRDYKLINSYVEENSFFVGRTSEIESIHRALSDNNRAIVTGIGGIGKTETISRFIKLYQNEYGNVLIIHYNIGIIDSIIRSDFISNFKQLNGEDEYNCCIRKLRLLSELINRRTLFVIDGFDEEFENVDEDSKKVIKKVMSLPCDVVITTRCNQNSYSSFQINLGILSLDVLEKIYGEYSHYNEDEEVFLSHIIESYGNHTLLVELLAKYARNTGFSPKKLSETLEKEGLIRSNRVKVDWNLSSETVLNHIKRLFRFTRISDNQLHILSFISLMFSDRVNREELEKLYSDLDLNDLLYLIDNGWISRDSETTFEIHPLIKTVSIEELKKNNRLFEELYCNCTRIFNLKIGEEAINKENYVLLKNLVSNTRYFNINTLKAADFLTQYVSYSIKNSKFISLADLIDFSIDIYNSFYDDEVYCAVREKAYITKCNLENSIGNWAYVEEEFKNRFNLAKNNEDNFICSLWFCSLKVKAIFMHNLVEQWRYEFNSALYSDRLESEIIKTEFKAKQIRLNYGYLSELDLNRILTTEQMDSGEMGLEDCDLFSYSKRYSFNVELDLLGYNIKRNSIKILYKNDSLNERIMIFNKAKIKILERKYDDALEEINKLICFYNENNRPIDSIIIEAYYYLGILHIINYNYKEAVVDFEKSIKYDEELEISNLIYKKIRLIRAMILSDDINEAKNVNDSIYDQVIESGGIIEEKYLASIIFNRVLIKLAQNDLENLEEYEEATEKGLFDSSDQVVFYLSRLVKDFGESGLSHVKRIYREAQRRFGKNHFLTKELKKYI